ncbi:MAG: hypothetical protein LUI10_05570 [Lachnospiraceae bacterium]|nr:hypothetical protein [Lachnospiraceae bacterium]
MKKWIFSILLTVMMGLALLPNTKVSATEAEGAVAQIGDMTYATLDEAIAAASGGDTIVVLKSTTVSKINLRNSNYGGIDIDLTIKGADGVNPTITFTDAGIQTSSHTLTIEDCTIVMNDLQAPNVSWGTIFFDTGGVMNLNNVTMTLDGTNAPSGGTNAIYTHGIYFYGSNTLNITNSTVTIQNYPQDALEWNGTDGDRATYDLNIVNSTFICDGNRSGLAGTFDMKIDNSIVKVTNSTGNGSNGTYYTITNKSYVEFANNRNWGISAYRIDMSDNSTLTAHDNGWSGVWVRILNVDGTSTLDVERNGAKSDGYTTNAGIFFQGNGSYTSTIEAGAKVTIKDNAGSGIYTNQSVCNLTINTDAVITNNGTGAVDANGHGAKYGGGVYNIGTMVLCDDVIIYNNHADEAGDDIYSNGVKSITFGDVNSNAAWVLDDCDDVIDGWYEDGYETVTLEYADGSSLDTTQRWSANCECEGYIYTELKDSGTYIGTVVAYKAAHGYNGEKNSEPGINKSVVTEDGDTVDNPSANAGDSIYYELASTIPSTLVNYISYTYDEETSTAVGEVNYTIIEDKDGNEVKNYASYILTFHDDMPDAITLNSDTIKVYIGEKELDSEYYDVVTSGNGTCGCDFEVSLDLLKLYTDGIINETNFGLTSVIVAYTATLSEDAGAGTYTNTAWVSYLDKNSEKDIVDVEVYGVDIFKYDQSDYSEDEEGNIIYAGLKGAEFTLYRLLATESDTEEDSGAMSIADDDEETTAPENDTTIPTKSELTDTELYEVVDDTLKSGDDGHVSYEGLAAGTYYLVETKAPNGYVKADTVLEIVIPVNADDETNLAYTEFANAPIPSTGGMGTTPFKAVGMSLLLAAGVVYAFTLKRKKEEV